MCTENHSSKKSGDDLQLLVRTVRIRWFGNQQYIQDCFFNIIFLRGSFYLLTVSGQVAFFTPADVLFHPDNIDLLGEQKQFYLCHRVLAEGDGHVWIISSCHLTNPNWHLLWFSSQLLKIARQPTCCRCVLGLLCNSSVSYTARYTRPSLRMQDKRFPHPKYKWVVRGLDCFIHRFIFICGGCLSYTMVAAFNLHT